MAVSIYLQLGAIALVAELLRRCYVTLMFAFTGPMSKIPGPFLNKLSAAPHMLTMAKGNDFLYKEELHKIYGDIVRFEPNTISVSDRALVRKIVVEWDLPKATILHKMVNAAEPDGISIVTEVNKEKHKQRRRVLSHGFSVSYLKAIEPRMIDCIGEMKEVMDKAVEDGGGSAILNMYAILSGCTFDVMSASSFGGSFHEVRHLDSPPDSVKVLVVKQLTLLTIHAAIPFAKYMPWIFPPVREPLLEKILDSTVERRRALEKKDVKKDLLQIFLNAHEEDPNSFTEIDIRSEMKFFTIAGSDTSGAILTFALQFLLDNPETLEILIEEVDAAVPSLNDPITAENTKNLVYLNAVINETLRLRPPTPQGMSRETPEPLQLGEYFLPAGTQVTADHYTLQHSDAVFPSANDFIPSRWITPYKGVPVAEDAFYSFAAGTRSCIGKQFALMEMRLMMVSLVRRYNLKLVEGQSPELSNNFVLHLKAGKYFVEVSRRL